jgi:hypothetical protein
MGQPVMRPGSEVPDLSPQDIAEAEASFARVAATWDQEPSSDRDPEPAE